MFFSPLLVGTEGVPNACKPETVRKLLQNLHNDYES